MTNEVMIWEAARAVFDADHADCSFEGCEPTEESWEECVRVARAVLKIAGRHMAIDELVLMDFGNES